MNENSAAPAGRSAARLPTVSVVVAHYEQHRDLRRTLEALDRQTYPRELVEIVVVDDGSATPPTVPAHIGLVVQEDAGFRLAAARNRGVAASRGEILCFLDADCAPEPDYLAELTRPPAGTWDVVTVGTRKHADLSSLPDDHALDALPPAAVLEDPAWLRDAYARSHHLRHADARSYRYVIGAVIGCSRRFFDEVGGFDESFTSYGGEDWEWAWRAWNHGAVFAHVAAAVAWHNGPDAAGRDRPREALDAETRRVQGLIPLPGSRPHALVPEAPDVVVVLPPIASAAQLIVTADSILRRLPTARIHVASTCPDAEDMPAELTRDPRIATTPPEPAPYRIDVLAPVRIEPEAPLRDLLDRVGVGGTGAIRVLDDTGPLVTVTTSRVDARRHRWGPDALTDETLPALGIARRISGDGLGLAAYYGDWD